MLPPGVCWRRRRKGGGGALGFCLVAKQAVKFPQVLASQYNLRREWSHSQVLNF